MKIFVAKADTINKPSFILFFSQTLSVYAVYSPSLFAPFTLSLSPLFSVDLHRHRRGAHLAAVRTPWVFDIVACCTQSHRYNHTHQGLSTKHNQGNKIGLLCLSLIVGINSNLPSAWFLVFYGSKFNASLTYNLLGAFSTFRQTPCVQKQRPKANHFK